MSGLLNTSVALTYWMSLSPFWPLDGTWFVSDDRRSSFLLLTLTGDFGGDSEVGLLSDDQRSSFLLLTLTGDFGGDSEVGLLSNNKWQC